MQGMSAHLADAHAAAPAWGRRSVRSAGLALACALAAVPALSRTDARALRALEEATCLPGELMTWGDGRDRAALFNPLRLSYRHEGAPPWFSATQVMQALLRAVDAWSACGVATHVRQDDGASASAQGDVLVHWNDGSSAGSFGLAHLGQRTLALGRGAFELLRQRNPAHPAYEVLQMTVSHEIGHFYGLMGHSRRCVDVMSYYTDSQGQTCRTRDGGSHRRLPEYRALLPTACDIARCRAANGMAPSVPASAPAAPLRR
jgi:hypothetical protein